MSYKIKMVLEFIPVTSELPKRNDMYATINSSGELITNYWDGEKWLTYPIYIKESRPVKDLIIGWAESGTEKKIVDFLKEE